MFQGRWRITQAVEIHKNNVPERRSGCDFGTKRLERSVRKTVDGELVILKIRGCGQHVYRKTHTYAVSSCTLGYSKRPFFDNSSSTFLWGAEWTDSIANMCKGDDMAPWHPHEALFDEVFCRRL
jgi:hypothetical protein